jgi:GNAT superfamily N-acetyltransferase
MAGSAASTNTRPAGESTGTGSVILRPATADDLEHILHHRRAMFLENRDGGEAQCEAVVAACRPYFAKTLADGTYRGWLAVDGDRVVGGAGLLVHEWPSNPSHPENTRRAYILNVYIEPPYRHRGLARRLMHAAIEHCRAEGFKTVWLHASDAGRPLYEAMGFKTTNEMRLDGLN